MRIAPAMLAVLCCSVACSGQKTSSKEVKISREELGNAWPFTVSEGTLACHAGEVVFTANNKTYAVNGMAASSKKYAEIEAIWDANPMTPAMRKDMGAILDRGAKLCG